MAIYVLEIGDKQYRSEKANAFATTLALQLRGHHPMKVSTYRLAKYCSIDDLKGAVSAMKKGDTLKII